MLNTMRTHLVAVEEIREHLLDMSDNHLINLSNLEASTLATMEHKYTKLMYEMDQLILDLEAENNDG